MSGPWWLLGVGLIVAGLAILLAVVGAARLDGPDTAGRDPSSQDGDTCDGSCAGGIRTGCVYCGVEQGVGLDHEQWCPRGGVDVALDGPDGSHDVLPDVDAQRWADELIWLHEQMPEAVLLDQGDDLLARPPIVPGRDSTP